VITISGLDVLSNFLTSLSNALVAEAANPPYNETLAYLSLNRHALLLVALCKCNGAIAQQTA